MRASMATDSPELSRIAAEALDIAKSAGQAPTTAHLLLATFTVPGAADVLLRERGCDEDRVLDELSRAPSRGARAVRPGARARPPARRRLRQPERGGAAPPGRPRAPVALRRGRAARSAREPSFAAHHRPRVPDRLGPAAAGHAGSAGGHHRPAGVRAAGRWCPQIGR